MAQNPPNQTVLADKTGAKPMEIEFLLVVDGISMDDECAATIIADEFDAIQSESRGLMRLAVSAEGLDPVNALAGLLIKLAQRLPELRVLRLDPDLVGVSDIAERTGRSRQNVQQWVDGERHAEAGTFPAPEGTAGRSLVWRWSDVYAWLSNQDRELVEEERVPSRTDALAIDLFLMHWLQSRAAGMPMLKTVAPAGDDRTDERWRIGALANAAAGDPQFLAALTSLPRENKHQITVVCAVPLDTLDFVVQQLAGETTGVIAVEAAADQLVFLPIASVPLPYSIPITALDLSPNATVGDLLLAQQKMRVAPSTPMMLCTQAKR